ncbi:putative paraoxonase [Colletotrichum zoysiae]|uniref:Paraoxonase n=1 Tax=Colletotrichum zoysiae TaxID=1216348 RepID=A0AAD9HCX0_9PEZI|nr:putative paraoxonase [Colletotrichum zoysiae]
MQKNRWLGFGAATVVILLAALYPYMSTRIRALSFLWTNSPSKLREFKAFSKYELKFRDELRNCEDALMVEEDGLVILSCDPGRDLWNTVMGTFTKPFSAIPPGALYVYQYADAAAHQPNALSRVKLLDFPEVSKFHPLGIEYHRASGRLFVSNHHFDGPRVEVFALETASQPPTARHIKTIIDPLIRSPNSIVALNEAEVFLTNDHLFRIRDHRILAKVETYGGFPLGGIVHMRLHSNLSVTLRSVARLPYANGVTLLNDSMLAVASTSSCQVRLYHIRPDRALELASKVDVPFMPDNLATDQRGVLIIAGHPHPPSLEAMVKARQACLKKSSMIGDCHVGTAPSWVSEWTPEGGLKTLYSTVGEFGSSSSAARDAGLGLGIMTGLYEKGIMVWRE